MTNEIESITVWGYHGTLQENVEGILSQGFQLSRNPWEWLGDGVYFWQDAPNRAREWAEEWAARGTHQSVEKTAIIQAKLRLENCIDMLDVGWRDALEELSKDFLGRIRKTPEFAKLKNHRIGTRRGRHELDAAFFNYAVGELANTGMRVSSIRAAITEGEPILPDSPLCYKSHVQICILNTSLIEEVHIV